MVSAAAVAAARSAVGPRGTAGFAVDLVALAGYATSAKKCAISSDPPFGGSDE